MSAMTTRWLTTLAVVTVATALLSGQSAPATLEAETLRHFRALIQADTSSPPGNEIRAVE